MPISLPQVFALAEGMPIPATDDVYILGYLSIPDPQKYLGDIKAALKLALDALPSVGVASAEQRAAVVPQFTALVAGSAAVRHKLKLKANSGGTQPNPSTDPNGSLASKPPSVRVVVEVSL